MNQHPVLTEFLWLIATVLLLILAYLIWELVFGTAFLMMLVGNGC